MNLPNRPYIGQDPDVSRPFFALGNAHFNVNALEDFDLHTLSGRMRFEKFDRKTRTSFNTCNAPFEPSTSWTFPPAYDPAPSFPFQVDVVAENILRLRMSYARKPQKEKESLMLTCVPQYEKAAVRQTEHGAAITTGAMGVEITFSPFSLTLYNKNGKLLTKTLHSTDSMCLDNSNPLPLSYVVDSADMKKTSAFSLSVSPGEAFFGCGESFSRLNKAGQKINLWTRDPHGVETEHMYKPIPFYQSSHGYGVFAHTSVPVTADLAHTYMEAQTLFIAEEQLDIFLIVGSPKEILSGYTLLTGRPPVPPLWSYGLWMGGITYQSKAEVQGVVQNLKQHQIPCDVIHIDTGWFEHNWRCDYQFSESRFAGAEKMIADLKAEGYRISLWQLPYFTPNNQYYQELLAKGLAITNADGELPTEDVILDFSNPKTVAWYQGKLKELLAMGVAAIKADFGEAAPVTGLYASGASGHVEHNLYPLRYNKAVADITQEVTGNAILWGRSAWAGSQRYPIHWGGDAENTNMGMLCSLRGGLSLGMSGFSFWSHDLGGFVRKTPEELYRRWAFMGIFTSHLRCHGQLPKEPWAFSQSFLALFRRQMQFRYTILPYIQAQAEESAKKGYPMLRTMHFEFPDDTLCPQLEDQYMFGTDMLIAPFFEANISERPVYLPKGIWYDIISHKAYTGGQVQNVSDCGLCGVALVRGGAEIPMVEHALTTDHIDWSTLAYHPYS